MTEANRQVVLFLCDHNSARSQMAEGFLKAYAGNYFEVHSSGTNPTGLHPLAVRVMEEIGIDISRQESKSTGVYLGRLVPRYVIFVCQNEESACPSTWPFSASQLRWPLDDPAALEGSEEAKLEMFRAVRDRLDAQIKQWLGEVLHPLKPSVTP